MENDDTKETWGKKRKIRELRVRNCSDVSLWDDDINTGWRQYFYDVHFFHSSSGLIYQGLNFQRNVAKKSESSGITTKLKQHLILFWRNNWKDSPSTKMIKKKRLFVVQRSCRKKFLCESQRSKYKKCTLSNIPFLLWSLRLTSI